MPKNPSKKQRAASRKNLYGKQGPKTIKGKIRSAQNGRLNKGVKTAKSRAIVLAARWKNGTNTFYHHARCIDCEDVCTYKSFSHKTPIREMPLRCLERIIREKPDRCFYYFEGVCSLGFRKNPKEPVDDCSCLFEPNLLESYRQKPNQTEPELERLELNYRLRNMSYKNEMKKYLQIIHHRGPEHVNWTPRMKHLVRFFSDVMRLRVYCRFEPSWSEQREWDEALEWLTEAISF